MGTYREPTPWDQPYPGAHPHLKAALSKNLDDFFYLFEHEDREKTSMSRLLRLHETMILSRAKEIGGSLYRHVQDLMQACSNFANGQGKIESVDQALKQLRDDLRG